MITESIYVPAAVRENLNPSAGPITMFEPFNPAALSVKDCLLLMLFTQAVSKLKAVGDAPNILLDTTTFRLTTADIPQLFTALTDIFPEVVPHVTVIVGVFLAEVIIVPDG